MRTKMTIAALAAAALVAIGCGAGDDASVSGDTDAPAAAAASSAAPEPKGYRVGGAVTVKQGDTQAVYTILKQEKRATDDFDQKAAGGQWLLLHLKVEVKAGQLYACDCALSLVDNTNRVYVQGFATFETRPAFRSSDLKAGQHTDGWVIFEAPKKLTGAKVQLKITELFGDDEYAYWNL